MGNVNPTPARLALEAEVIRPIHQPLLGSSQLGMGKVRQGTQAGIDGVRGWLMTAAQDPDFMIAQKGQPARPLPQMLKGPEAEIAAGAAVDEIPSHDHQVRGPGLDVGDAGLHGREVGLHVGKDGDPHAGVACVCLLMASRPDMGFTSGVEWFIIAESRGDERH